MTSSRTSATRNIPLLVGLGAVLVAVYAAFVLASPAVRHYWPLPLVAAALAAVPFLLHEPRPRRDPALPWNDPAPAADLASAVPALRASVVSVPRSDGESEDGHAIDVATGHVAVADGASTSFRAAEWARLLCTTFLAERPCGGHRTTTWIETAATAFREQASGEGAWWRADAAFVGLAVLRHPHGLTWRATAVGDCVLVHRRPAPTGPVVTAFPIAHSAAFPADPPLLSGTAGVPPPVSSVEGRAQVGDSWLLMTGELARWALRRQETGDPAWDLLTGSEVVVITAIATARATGEVVDDDMTVVRCTLVSAG